MTSTEQRSCPVCESQRKEVLFHQQFHSLSEGGLLSGYDVVVCRGCGMGFADRLPRAEAFDRYYREMSKYEYAERNRELSSYDLRRFPDAATQIARLVPDREARILEIGCANGGLLAMLQERGYKDLLGLDPSPACATAAFELYGLSVRTGGFAKATANDEGRFDLVILISVLEHLRDLQSSLDLVCSYLKPRGYLFVEVPDATAFALSPDAPFQEFSTEHINYFSPASLEGLMRGRGFTSVLVTQVAREQNVDKTNHEIQAAFRKENPSTQVAAFDPTTRAGLVRYIGRSKATERRLHAILDSLASQRSPLLVWGVGTHTQRLLRTSPLAQANIVAFVDSNPKYQGKTLDGKPILAPADLAERTGAILISSRVFQTEIAEQIRNKYALPHDIVRLYETSAD